MNGEPFDLLNDDPIPREKFRHYAHDNLDRPLGTGKESTRPLSMELCFALNGQGRAEHTPATSKRQMLSVHFL
jgi:hypothetical protein